MSRRPANFIQADVARALRAAQQVGPEWQVEIEGSCIRLRRAETLAPLLVVQTTAVDADAKIDWKF